MVIIERHEAELLKKINKWTMVFGRRKTGKTFLVKRTAKYDEYFFVKRDRTIFVESTAKDIVYDTFIELFSRMLKDNKTIVVDEFHRLGDGFLDYLHMMDKTGKLYVVSSTFHLSKKLVGSHSPLLGVFAEFPVELIRVEDVAGSFPKGIDKKELLELSILLSEPLAIGYYEKDMKPMELASTLISSGKFLVPALIGEIFNEEERKMTNIYSAILRAIASGKNTTTEISSFLFSRKLIEKDNPGSVTQYLQNLLDIKIIKKVSIANKKSYMYEHVSHLIEMYYYGDEKYNLSEMEFDNKHVTSIVENIFPRIVERYVRSFLARKFGLGEAIIKEADYDIDGYLTKFKSCEIALEVKWKNEMDGKDIADAEETLSKVKSKRKLFFVPDKSKVNYKRKLMEVVDFGDFL
jgi:hypothetical protein